MAETSELNQGTPIIAKGSRDYRWRRYVLVLFILGYGIYSLYDGFIHYPAQNRQDQIDHPGISILRYTELDITLNKVFGIVLPPASALLLAWAIYKSRGEYRFDGKQLSVPGHPVISINDIQKIDISKWDRKGIAYLHYQLASSGDGGVITLDDFIYDRIATDSIYKQIELAMTADDNIPAVQPETGY